MNKKLLLPITVFLETFIVFFLISIPTEYLLTEKYLLTPTISNTAKTIVFITIFIITFLANYLTKNTLSSTLLIFLIILFAATLVGNRAYTNYYQSLQNKPKIYSLSSPWGIQSMVIKIRGKNFGPTHEKGEVWVDDLPLLILDWTETKIRVEIPVPDRHFKGKIYVEDAQGEESNKLPFEIRDPDTLSQ